MLLKLKILKYTKNTHIEECYFLQMAFEDFQEYLRGKLSLRAPSYAWSKPEPWSSLVEVPR